MATTDNSSSPSQQDTPLQRALDGAVLQRLQLVEACTPKTKPPIRRDWAFKATTTPVIPTIRIDRPIGSPATLVASHERPVSTRPRAQPQAQATGFPYLSGSTIDVSENSTHHIEIDGRKFWLSGSTVMCSCPDCNAPMTIRLWLRLADCWRCEASVGMSRAEVDAVKKMVGVKAGSVKSPAAKSRPSLSANLPDAPPKPVVVGHATTSLTKKTNQPKPQRKKLPLPPPRPVNHPLLPTRSDPFADQKTELDRLARRSYVAQWLQAAGASSLLWTVAAVLIMAAVGWIGLARFGSDSVSLADASALADGRAATSGSADPADRLADDLALTVSLESGPEILRAALLSASNDAVQLQTDPAPLVPLRDLTQVKSSIEASPKFRMSFAGRDPRLRSQIVRSQGGSTITEAAVAKGVRWLASVQNQDGGWSLKNYTSHDQPGNPSDSMATSLALLPMLGAGQTHQFGYHKKTVSAGLKWLIDHQLPSGDLSASSQEESGMLAHGQATVVLCEALAMTGDPKLVAPAQAACRFIEASQHGQGGWRSKPTMAGDVSVFGWQVMALQSGRASQAIEVDGSTLRLADIFLDRLSVEATFENEPNISLPRGSAYAYQSSQLTATPAMTAEAILCRMYQGWQRNDPRLRAAVDWLLSDHLPSSRNKNLSYWYYATQVMRHYGGTAWHKWNDRMRPLLLTTQQADGQFEGSWGPKQFESGARGGRIYSTSLAVCTLEVYYRHLPIYQQLELEP
jgi:hypothetical protein